MALYLWTWNFSRLLWDTKCRPFVSPFPRSVWWQVSGIAPKRFFFTALPLNVLLHNPQRLISSVCYRVSALTISYHYIFKRFLRMIPSFLIFCGTFVLTFVFFPAWVVCKHFLLIALTWCSSLGWQLSEKIANQWCWGAHPVFYGLNSTLPNTWVSLV